jgi:hypothetical protein
MITSKIKINKEYAKLVSEISQSDYEPLKASVKLKQHEIVLECHHRYKACKHKNS